MNFDTATQAAHIKALQLPASQLHCSIYNNQVQTPWTNQSLQCTIAPAQAGTGTTTLQQQTAICERHFVIQVTFVWCHVCIGIPTTMQGPLNTCLTASAAEVLARICLSRIPAGHCTVHMCTHHVPHGLQVPRAQLHNANMLGVGVCTCSRAPAAKVLPRVYPHNIPSRTLCAHHVPHVSRGLTPWIHTVPSPIPRPTLLICRNTRCLYTT